MDKIFPGRKEKYLLEEAAAGANEEGLKKARVSEEHQAAQFPVVQGTGIILVY